MHHILPKHLAVSIKEGIKLKHRTAFDAFTSGLEASDSSAELAAWKRQVLEWEVQPHLDLEGSPFEIAEEDKLSLDLQVTSEEFLCTEAWTEINREHTPGSFITLGLELEETQRKLEVDVRALKDPLTAFTKRRTTLLRRIYKFRQVQAVYMPTVRVLLSETQKAGFDGNGQQLPEATRLFMLWELGSREVRGRACATGLTEIEARMRYGEASDALEAVRNGLRARTMTNRYKLATPIIASLVLAPAPTPVRSFGRPLRHPPAPPRHALAHRSPPYPPYPAPDSVCLLTRRPPRRWLATTTVNSVGLDSFPPRRPAHAYSLARPPCLYPNIVRSFVPPPRPLVCFATLRDTSRSLVRPTLARSWLPTRALAPSSLRRSSTLTRFNHKTGRMFSRPHILLTRPSPMSLARSPHHPRLARSRHVAPTHPPLARAHLPSPCANSRGVPASSSLAHDATRRPRRSCSRRPRPF
ncbi:hypothetical protein R3P38DRAFT_3246345 [Favolaschia claudopus]|uniref:Uncharacterized protein n=1 Tax=Favolaschia claudopus TaxID=2862362 RepID=A0AAV9Z0R4_9AGAR